MLNSECQMLRRIESIRITNELILIYETDISEQSFRWTECTAHLMINNNNNLYMCLINVGQLIYRYIYRFSKNIGVTKKCQMEINYVRKSRCILNSLLIANMFVLYV